MSWHKRKQFSCYLGKKDPQEFASEWQIEYEDDLVQLLKFDLDLDTYPYLMHILTGAVSIDREYGFAGIKLESREADPASDASMVVKKKTIYLVAFYKRKRVYEIGYRVYRQRHFINPEFTEFGETYKEMLGGLPGLQVSRSLFRQALLGVINSDHVGSRKRGAGMFAFVVSEAGRFSWIRKALTIVFCLDMSIELTGKYKWMALIPMLWWKFSMWDRELQDMPELEIAEGNPEQDMTNEAAEMLTEADKFDAPYHIKRWGRQILTFASWDKTKSSITKYKSLDEVREERGQIKLWDGKERCLPMQDEKKKEQVVKKNEEEEKEIEEEEEKEIDGEEVKKKVNQDVKYNKKKMYNKLKNYRKKLAARARAEEEKKKEEEDVKRKEEEKVGKNSIDFLLKVDKKNQPMLYLRKDTMIMDKSCGRLGDPSTIMSTFSGKIITCSWDYKANSWVYESTPLDKSQPDTFSRYTECMQMIEDDPRSKEQDP